MPTKKKVKEEPSYLVRSLRVFSIIALLGVFVVFGVLIALKLSGVNVGNNKDDVESITKQVSKLMVLPDETPTLATVIDKEQLIKQGFFKTAENEDKVLIFPKSGKAILYRPSLHKIVDVVPVKTVSPTPQTQQQLTPTPTVSSETPRPSPAPTKEEAKKPTKVDVYLLNGSKTPGATTPIMNKLTEQYDFVTIVDRQVAKKNDYQGILVIPLTDNGTSIASDFATFLGGKVGELPQGEQGSGDILIIVGN